MALMASATDPTEAALATVQLTEVGTFAATATPVGRLPADQPKGLTLRKLGGVMDFSLTVALSEPGSAPADALARAMAALTGGAGPRLTFVAPGQDANLRLAVIPDSPRPDALWILPATPRRWRRRCARRGSARPPAPPSA